jgi:selenocysteine lyase/cysteine desulfurase
LKLRPWDFPDAPQAQAKELFAQICHCNSYQVAVTPSCSYAITTAAANLSVAPDEDIVVMEDHMANVLPWQAKATHTGARLVMSLRRDNVDPTATLLDHITSRTAVVAAAPCGWTDGAKVDLGAISRKCREHNAALVVDATQCIGAQPFDIQKLGADFVACSVHKWLLGLYSFAFLYAADKYHGEVGMTWHELSSSDYVAYSDDGIIIEHHDRNRVGSTGIAFALLLDFSFC